MVGIYNRSLKAFSFFIRIECTDVLVVVLFIWPLPLDDYKMWKFQILSPTEKY